MPRLPFSHSFRSAGRTNFLVVGLVAIAALGLAACSSSSQILPNVGGPVGGAGGASSGAYQPAASPAAGSGSDSGSGGGSGNGSSQARDPNVQMCYCCIELVDVGQTADRRLQLVQQVLALDRRVGQPTTAKDCHVLGRWPFNQRARGDVRADHQHTRGSG